MFLYGIIVPVIPFALEQRSTITKDRGLSLLLSLLSVPIPYLILTDPTVQYWVSVLIAIYGAALLAFSPICGWLADRTNSRRSPLLLGLVALLGSTILLNVATKIDVWVVGRILQGASAAVV